VEEVNLSASMSRSLARSHVCTSLADHNVTLHTAAEPTTAAVTDGDVSTEPLCDTATHCGDVVNRLSLPPTNAHHTHCRDLSAKQCQLYDTAMQKANGAWWQANWSQLPSRLSMLQ